jgi:hypothetical protein
MPLYKLLDTHVPNFQNRKKSVVGCLGVISPRETFFLFSILSNGAALGEICHCTSF